MECLAATAVCPRISLLPGGNSSNPEDISINSKRVRPSQFLWPSNGRHLLDEDIFGVWLKKLAETAEIKTRALVTIVSYGKLISASELFSGLSPEIGHHMGYF